MNLIRRKRFTLSCRSFKATAWLDLADVAIAVKDETGKANLHHAGNLLAEGAALPRFLWIASQRDLLGMPQ